MKHRGKYSAEKQSLTKKTYRQGGTLDVQGDTTQHHPDTNPSPETAGDPVQQEHSQQRTLPTVAVSAVAATVVLAMLGWGVVFIDHAQRDQPAQQAGTSRITTGSSEIPGKVLGEETNIPQTDGVIPGLGNQGEVRGGAERLVGGQRMRVSSPRVSQDPTGVEHLCMDISQRNISENIAYYDDKHWVVTDPEKTAMSHSEKFTDDTELGEGILPSEEDVRGAVCFKEPDNHPITPGVYEVTYGTHLPGEDNYETWKVTVRG